MASLGLVLTSYGPWHRDPKRTPLNIANICQSKRSAALSKLKFLIAIKKTYIIISPSTFRKKIQLNMQQRKIRVEAILTMDIWKKNFISTFHLFCVCKFTSLALFLKSFDIVCNATDTAHKMLFFPSHKVQCQGGKIILCWMVWCFTKKLFGNLASNFLFCK